MTWVWIVAATAAVGTCGALLLARDLRAKVAALGAEVTTLTDTAGAIRAEFERVGPAPASGVGDPGRTA